MANQWDNFHENMGDETAASHMSGAFDKNVGHDHDPTLPGRGAQISYNSLKDKPTSIAHADTATHAVSADSADSADTATTGPASSIGFYYPLHDGPSAGGSLMWNTVYDTDYGQWLTIGPTGSDANVIWTDLDFVPSGAKAVRVTLTAKINSGSSTLGNSISCKVAKVDTTESIGPCVEVIRQSTAANLSSKAIDVKLDNSRIFWFRWDKNITSGSGDVELYLEGYYK